MSKKLSGQSVLIVGANGSLAKETIKCLIKDGATKVVMGCRTAQKGEKARREILDKTEEDQVEISVVSGFDMNDPHGIENAVRSLKDERPFDLVFLAAGFAVFSDDYQAVEWNGRKVEKNVFQNMIGSHVTYQLLRKNQLINHGARVLIAGGEGARGIKGLIDRPGFTGPGELRDYIYLENAPKYNPMNAIGVSKLCGAFWTTKLAQVQHDHEIIWFSPGLTSGSAGLNDLPAVKRWFMNNVLFGIFSLIGQSQTPEKGGRKFADCLEGKVGKHGDLIGAPAGKSIGKLPIRSRLIRPLPIRC